MKTRRKGFTVVEILTVVTIIAILVGILIPSITKVRSIAKNTRQKAQIVTIGLAINSFKNDYGDYPESDLIGWADKNGRPRDYCGAQMLCEALLGWDLMGFHPKSVWRSDGRDASGNYLYELGHEGIGTVQQQEQNLRERIGPYLDRSQTPVAKIGDLFSDTAGLEEDTFVICDVFNFKKITYSSGNATHVGSPIIYYKARTDSKKLDYREPRESIYNWYDNAPLIRAKGIEDGLLAGTGPKTHEWLDRQKFYGEDPDYKYSIRDPKVTTRPWPYRPDSYLLISAGADGEYGTADDITNFR